MSDSTRSHSRAALVRIARILVATGLIGFLAARAGVADLRAGARPLMWIWLVGAALLVPVSIGVRAYNHALLLNRPVRVLGFRDAYLLTLAGIGINLIVPTGAADLAKAGWGARIHGSAEAMVVSSILDKLTSLTAVGILGLLGGLLAGMPVFAWSAAALVAASLVPTLFAPAMPWRLLLRVLAPGAEVDPERVRSVAKPPVGLLAWVYVVSLAGWLLTYGIMWACCRSAGALVDLQTVVAFAPLTSVARLLPVSVAGIGVGEVTLAALLGRAGVPSDVAARAVLLAMVLLVLLPGAAGALVVAGARRRT